MLISRCPSPIGRHSGLQSASGVRSLVDACLERLGPSPQGVEHARIAELIGPRKPDGLLLDVPDAGPTVLPADQPQHRVHAVSAGFELDEVDVEVPGADRKERSDQGMQRARGHRVVLRPSAVTDGPAYEPQILILGSFT